MLRGLVALALLAPLTLPTTTAETTVCVYMGGIKSLNSTRVSLTGGCGAPSAIAYFKIDDHGVTACIQDECIVVVRIFYEGPPLFP